MKIAGHRTAIPPEECKSGDTKNLQDKIFDCQGAGKTKATILKRKWNKHTSEMGDLLILFATRLKPRMQ